jgi:hypothetical protein
MQLLVGHGPDQRLKGCSLRLGLQGAVANFLDKATHYEI